MLNECYLASFCRNTILKIIPLLNGGNVLKPMNLSISQHPNYNLILFMVLSGEPKEKVDTCMRLNKIEFNTSKRMYTLALNQRVSFIRSIAVKKITLGILILFLAVTLFCSISFGLGSIPKAVLVTCIIGFSISLWKVTDGLIAYVFAKSRKGSLAHLADELVTPDE